MTTRQSTPTQSIVLRQPSSSRNAVNNGTSANWPRDVPDIARLMALPRPRSNQRLTIAPKMAEVVPPSPAAEITP